MENKKYIQYLKAIGGNTEEEFNEILSSLPPFEEFSEKFYIDFEEGTLEYYILKFGCLKNFHDVYIEDFDLQTKEIWLTDDYKDAKNFMEKYGWKVYIFD